MGDIPVPASIQYCSMHSVDLLVLSAQVVLFVLTGFNRDLDGGSVSLDCEGRLVPPVAAGGEGGILVPLA